MAIVIVRKPWERFAVSRATFYAGASDGIYPPPIKLGHRASGLPEHEVTAVLAARIAGRSTAEIRDLVQDLIAARQQAA